MHGKMVHPVPVKIYELCEFLEWHVDYYLLRLPGEQIRTAQADENVQFTPSILHQKVSVSVLQFVTEEQRRKVQTFFS